MEKSDIDVLAFLILLNIIVAVYQPFFHGFFVDEGQYLLISKKMLDGWIPYRDIIENKPLGMYLALIPAVLFGGTDLFKLRMYGALIVGLTSFFIFLIGKKLKDRTAGLFCALMFICFEAFPYFYGYVLLTEEVGNLFSVILFYILLFRKPSYKNIFLIGAFAAISCSIRQSYVFVFAPIAFDFTYYTSKLDKKKALAWMLGGIGLVLIPMLVYLAVNSALWDAFYWCFYTYIRFGGSSLGDKAVNFIYFSVPFLSFLIPHALTLKEITRNRKIMWLWLFGSLIILQFGYTWIHSYLLVIPPLSILAAVGILELYRMRGIKSKLTQILRAGVLVFLALDLAMIVITEVAMAGFKDIGYRIEDQSAISQAIASNTNKDDGIFVFMTDSYVYYLSDRKPVTKMTFFWMGYLQYMSDAERNEFIYEPLQRYKPKYFVMNYLMYQNDTIVLPLKEYVAENYNYVGTWGQLDLYEIKR